MVEKISLNLDDLEEYGGCLAPRPNIVVIFSDQQHWQALGCMDSFFITPAQDQFAKDSVVFTNAFCTTPQCSPSRSSLLTGLYPSKTGVWGNVGNAGGEPLRQHTVGAILQNAGYNTAYFGKWHLGNDERGTAGWGAKIFRADDGPTAKSARKFLTTIKNEHRTPFCLFVSYKDPHSIYRFRMRREGIFHPPVPFPASWQTVNFKDHPPCHEKFMVEDQGRVIHNKSVKMWERYRLCYRARNRDYDGRVGYILRKLRAIGEYDNTIVIITSDHGDMDTNHRLVFKGPFMYEHLLRVPFLIRVPQQFGGTPGQRVTDFNTINTDILPTILDFCGIPVDSSKFDGYSLRPLLTGNRSQQGREFIVIQYYGKQKWVNPIRTIRTTKFKYNLYLEQGEELFNLEADPNEMVNLSDDSKYEGVKTELARKLDHWMEVNKDPFYTQKRTDRQGHPINRDNSL